MSIEYDDYPLVTDEGNGQWSVKAYFDSEYKADWAVELLRQHHDVTYIRLDLHDAAVEQARRECWNRAITLVYEVNVRSDRYPNTYTTPINIKQRAIAALEGARDGK